MDGQHDGAITSVKSVPDAAALRTVSGEYDGQVVVLVSYYDDWQATGRGPRGGGCFVWNSTGAEADNGGTVFAVTGAPGQWERQRSGSVTPEMFGARSDGSDDTDAFQRMFAVGMPVELGPYTYSVCPLPDEDSIIWNRGSLFKPQSSVRGVPGRSKLVWVGEATAYFMALRETTGITIEGIHFVNGAGAVCIDPIRDYSVSDISIVNCLFEGQPDLAVSCGRQLAIDVNSRKCSKIKIRGCTFLNVRGHAVLVTNARDVEVVGNLFDGVWAGEGVNQGGFCIDVSQGVRGCVVSGNIARNSTYFAKTESYRVFGTIDDNQTTDVVIANNECIDMRPVYQSGAYVSGFAIFINSRIGNVVVVGNRVTYNRGNGIYIYGTSAGEGSVIVKGNVILQTEAGSYSSSGIYCEPNSSKRVLIQGNTVHGFCNGIVCNVGMVSVHGNDVSASQTAIAVNDASEVSIEGNDLQGMSGVTFGNVTPQFYKRIRACGNRIKASTGICFDMTNAHNPAGCVIQGNIFEKTGTGTDLPALSANDIESWVISGNTFSVPATSMRALGLFGTVKTSVIRDNITNGNHQIVSTDSATVQQGNLTSAAVM